MSLQVWLPLTKDLRNQGLCNIGTINSTAVYSATDGKLGGCYKFTNQIISMVPTTELKNSFSGAASISCWVKVSSSHSAYAQCVTYGIVSTAWTAIYFGIDINGSGVPIGNVANGSSNTNCSFTTAIKDNQWHHLCLTYTTGTIKSYLDGVLKTTTSTSCVPAWTNATIFTIGGNSSEVFKNGESMNDVRLYNHCLSEAEIKELSKGLVLHYPLNHEGLGNNNLLINSHNLSLWDNPSGSSTLQPNGYFKANYTGGGWWGPRQQVALIAGTTYTLSGWGYGDRAQLWFYQSGSVNASSTVNTTSSPQFLKVTYTPTASGNYYIVGYCATNQNNYYKGLHLEIGTDATPWAPNNSEFSNIIEYDCSGYCNNGTRTGSFSWTSDTPRYNISTAFEKGIISIPNSFVTTADPIFSVSLWFKLKSGITYTAYTDLISFSSSSYSNQPFRLELCGTPVGKSIMWFRGPSGQSGGFAVKSDISTDEWYHTVLVSEGNKQYSYYVNGEKLGTYNGSANSWTPTGNVSLGENINGVFYESDVRIYATALSAEDVLELYHTAARIDNIGNTYVYQYIET